MTMSGSRSEDVSSLARLATRLRRLIVQRSDTLPSGSIYAMSKMALASAQDARPTDRPAVPPATDPENRRDR